MKIIDNWQKNKFAKRQRAENPDEQTKKIIADRYLSSVYLEHLIHMIGLHEYTNNSRKRRIIELGGAGGVTSKYFPDIEVTDIRSFEGISKIVDAQNLPYGNSSIDLILAKDVLHHLPDVRMHFKEIERVLTSGGKIVYLEPNWNLISQFVFSFFHPEPYVKSMKNWQFSSNDPMDSNQALPWIIFKRDSKKWKAKYPHLSFEIGKTSNGIDFLLSGGVYFRNRINSSLLLFLRKLPMFGIFDISRIIVVTKA